MLCHAQLRRRRAAVPEDASAFYVPTFSCAFCVPEGGRVNVDRISSLASFLASWPQTRPFWDRFGGRNHMFAASCDLGACALPEAGPLRSVMLATLYPLTDLGTRSMGGHLHGVRAAEGGQGTCFVSGAGVAFPHWHAGDAAFAEETYGTAQNRSTLLYFFGSVAGFVKDTRRESRVGGYSQGVRWRVQEAARGEPDVVFIDSDVPRKAGEPRVDYVADMRRSVFCLAPSGHGYGVRLTTAVLTGCIPVVIQPSVHMPLDDVLPYWEFSVRLRFEEAPNIVSILRAIIPEAAVRELQRGLRRHYRSFVWESGGLAYEGVIASMQRKVYRIQSEL